MRNKKWHEYLWIVSILYLMLGFFNILFAWIGLLCFLIPLGISITGGGKTYCNKYCGRGQLFNILGTKYKLSRKKSIPKFIKSKWFRYGFLTFFMFMFVNMLLISFYVFKDVRSLNEVITLFWTFKVPWNWTEISFVPSWVAQFAFGFYSLMLTSTLLGGITMLLYKPRSWCVYCPMGTMTQGICKLKEMKNK
ncbi:4Fe-4S binding protein [Oceanirhabdus sp. W0125-5]|uniref:4Fe-4S binding protein n=1 Tax=Oceanirhabdus sp. W0125-5 TaxID=2999116 RepID=UPI0022F339EB|nr:4Fe-4S binding protein [Oceanirhabdus sp. W0125-5]WBW95164.1 4Fe-4S binding protein [Oceanirhabdus sp. W0125-5]